MINVKLLYLKHCFCNVPLSSMKTLLLIIVFTGTALAGIAQMSRPGSKLTRLKDSAQIKANDVKLSQKIVRLSFGVEYGLAIGQASDVYGTVLGGSVKFEIPVARSDFNITATVGFTDYLVHLDYTGPLTGIQSAQYIPVSLGGKYYFSRLFYVEGDAGISNNINSNYTAKSQAFYYAPIIGVSAPTSKHKANIDIGLRYDARVETGGTIGQIALRLAYKFGL